VSAELEELYCPVCLRESSFETPPCPDGHGGDCPERLCIRCGLVLAIAPTPATSARPARRRVA
jgi:hypothetical protein